MSIIGIIIIIISIIIIIIITVASGIYCINSKKRRTQAGQYTIIISVTIQSLFLIIYHCFLAVMIAQNPAYEKGYYY